VPLDRDKTVDAGVNIVANEKKMDRNTDLDVYLMGIAGTGMGAFAGLLKSAGYRVRGADQNVYPPMSDKLAEWDIEVRTPYSPQNLEPAPDLVIVGNVIRKDNVEAVAMRERGLEHLSFPEAFGRFFLRHRHPVVVAGTHGKTTTSALLSHALSSAGRDPGFLIGGIPQNFEESFGLGEDTPENCFVVEGDEYDTAYFDKGPKFMHYQPRSLLCTSLEFDHADIYSDVETIVDRFRDLLRLVPQNGFIVLCNHAPHLLRACREANPKATVVTYGADGDWQANNVKEDARGIAFTPSFRGQERDEMRLSLSGKHNLQNALGAFAILENVGLSVGEIKASFGTFEGVKRRMEIIGSHNGILVVDDFAHHPTAVRMTLDGAKAKYADRRIWALFEPRSASSCRRIFQSAYADAFASADRIVLAPLGRELPPDEALDLTQLTGDLSDTGKQTVAADTVDAIVDIVKHDVEPGDLLLCMSNGGFGGIHQKLLRAIKEKFS
jgi:UDP-N-acetylmuramate: L-alanyl-gamma-D-glutamyl-meso-diaminopimelate ligase